MTITKKERERVAELLGYWPGYGGHDSVAKGQGDTINGLAPEDIDRVAQALRDAAPQWREVTATEPAAGVRVLGSRAGEFAFTVERLSNQTGWWADSAVVGGRRIPAPPTHWMPLPAPPLVVEVPTRPSHCHGQCINAPEGTPPLQRTFNMVCGGCQGRIEALERTVAWLVSEAMGQRNGAAK